MDLNTILVSSLFSTKKAGNRMEEGAEETKDKVD
jgi:hypothetical protein